MKKKKKLSLVYHIVHIQALMIRRIFSASTHRLHSSVHDGKQTFDVNPVLNAIVNQLAYQDDEI